MKIQIIRQAGPQPNQPGKKMTIALLILLVVVAMNLLQDENLKNDHILQAILGFTFLAVLYSLIRSKMSRIDITEVGITVRNIFRVKRLMWEDIDSVLVDKDYNVRLLGAKESLTINIFRNPKEMMAEIERYTGKPVIKTANIYEGETRTWPNGKMIKLTVVMLVIDLLAAILAKNVVLFLTAILGFVSGGIYVYNRANPQMARKYSVLSNLVFIALLAWYGFKIAGEDQISILPIIVLLVLYFINLVVGATVTFNTLEDKRRRNDTKQVD